MERNLRIAAPFAGGAVVISLFVALFAGVPLGTALWRAVLSGGAFGLLSFGVALVAQTQLAGFGGSLENVNSHGAARSGAFGQGGGPQPEAPQSGSRLNIVVEDDDQYADVDAESDAGTDAEPDATSDADEMTDDPETASRRAPGVDSGTQSGPAAVDQTESRAPLSTDAGSAEGESAGGPASPDSFDEEDEPVEELVEEVEESAAEDEEAVMKAAISEEQDGTSVEIDDTMLDEMPDIGSFAGSFVSGGDSGSAETGDAMGGAGEAGTFSGGTKQKKGDPRKGFDNKSIAKALQTFMAKDSD